MIDSITRSTPFNPVSSEVGVTRARASSRSDSVRLPFSTCRFSDFSSAASVASAVDWLRDPEHHLEAADGGRLGDARAHDPGSDDTHACD